jgi:hypothetical protein
MADLLINKLKSNGTELFSDSESFMGELSDNELSSTTGGATPAAIWATVQASSFYCGRAVSGVASLAYTIYEVNKK